MAYQPTVRTNDDDRRAHALEVLQGQLSQLKSRWVHLYDCIDLTRVSEANCFLTDNLAADSYDFESISRGGRGELYRRAQQNPLVRRVGILRLFEMASPDQNLMKLTSEHKILDVLGGDGALARALQLSVAPESMPSVLISDLSQDMVLAAQSYGLFAIRQAAQDLLIKDDVLDGVIVAYGTHHIPRDQRLQTCKEAFRVLKPGGRIVLHDFEVDSSMCRWFKHVVNEHSITGHDFPHFTSEDIREYISGAGFEAVSVNYMYDPFIFFSESRHDVEQEAAEFVTNMYGLVKLVERMGYDEAVKAVFALICEYFKYDYKEMKLDESFGSDCVRITKDQDSWKAEVPRVALVGCATKPLN